jgi:hypothetical protein
MMVHWWRGTSTQDSYTWIKRKITSDETGYFSAKLIKQKYSDDYRADEQNTIQFCISISMSFRNTAHIFACRDFFWQDEQIHKTTLML